MRVEFDIPDVEDGPIRPGRTLRRMFRAEGPTNYRDQAILENLVRLARHAAIDYRLGKAATIDYWDDSSSLNVGAILRAATHFETTITNVHRAICYLKLATDSPSILVNAKIRLPDGLGILQQENQNQIRYFRHAIQHQEERIEEGRIAEGEVFLPLATGDEVSDGDNSVLTINRIELGPMQIEFSDLAALIGELRQCALILVDAEYS